MQSEVSCTKFLRGALSVRARVTGFSLVEQHFIDSEVFEVLDAFFDLLLVQPSEAQSHHIVMCSWVQAHALTGAASDPSGGYFVWVKAKESGKITGRTGK